MLWRCGDLETGLRTQVTARDRNDSRERPGKGSDRRGRGSDELSIE
jgi:hypothetical protein